MTRTKAAARQAGAGRAADAARAEAAPRASRAPWRNSLPARIALSTAGLLALVLLVTAVASYAITAVLLRQGVDSALTAALPLTAQGVHDLLERSDRFESRDLGHQYVQVLDLSGQVQEQPSVLPVSPAAVAQTLATGRAFTSIVSEGGLLQNRLLPDWWQTLTPRQDELRVLYALVRTEQGPMILQLAAPLGPAGQELPILLWWLLALAGLGSLLSGAIAWRMAAKSYRPLQAITATAKSITKETLSHRLEDGWEDRTLHELVQVLNAMIARLETAFAAQERFTAAAAHELRSPLAAMRADLEVALRRDRSAEEYRESLAVGLAETDRLAALAEHLLILARYERGAAPAAERSVALQPLLEHAAQEVRRGTGADIRVSVPAGLSLDVDPLALERAVTNLVRNGVQAGGEPVTIRASEEAGAVVIEVEDSGTGIAADVLPRVFEPFFRGDPARRHDGGTGLGLAIVRVVAEAHGGTVEVSSRPGEGTTFRLRLPLSPPSPSPSASPSPPPQRPPRN